jgi:hypothetical protein
MIDRAASGQVSARSPIAARIYDVSIKIAALSEGLMDAAAALSSG